MYNARQKILRKILEKKRKIGYYKLIKKFSFLCYAKKIVEICGKFKFDFLYPLYIRSKSLLTLTEIYQFNK